MLKIFLKLKQLFLEKRVDKTNHSLENSTLHISQHRPLYGYTSVSPSRHISLHVPINNQLIFYYHWTKNEIKLFNLESTLFNYLYFLKYVCFRAFNLVFMYLFLFSHEFS